METGTPVQTHNINITEVTAEVPIGLAQSTSSTPVAESEYPHKLPELLAALPITGSVEPIETVETVESSEPAISAALPSQGSSEHQFRVFNAMLYKDMPRVGTRIPVVYESPFFIHGELADGTPNDLGIAQAVQNAHAQYTAPWFAESDLMAVDIERWYVWPFAQGTDHRASIAKYASTLERFGQAMQTPVCLYNIVPQAGINHAVLSKTNQTIRDGWTAASQVANELLVPHIDAFCPALYTYYDDDADRQRWINQWTTYAEETIREARRISPDKPVYVFLWPQFHAGGNVEGFTFLSQDYWRAQLETVQRLADGVILWGGWNFEENTQLDWDPDVDWYATFMGVFPDH